ncbi:hypothetical protein Avbf_14621 [Armadillidium vulgare]|nr:hypothetical protein Avbf_14621 [Armadillidium vulgare]
MRTSKYKIPFSCELHHCNREIYIIFSSWVRGQSLEIAALVMFLKRFEMFAEFHSKEIKMNNDDESKEEVQKKFGPTELLTMLQESLIEGTDEMDLDLLSDRVLSFGQALKMKKENASHGQEIQRKNLLPKIF